jgi:hypothetical protein
MAMSVKELRCLMGKHDGNVTAAAKELGVARATLWSRLKTSGVLAEFKQGSNTVINAGAKKNIQVKKSGIFTHVTYYGEEIKTEEQLLSSAKIDMALYEIYQVIVNNWEVSGAKKKEDGIWKTGLRQIKVILRRKSDEKIALERLLADIQKNSKRLTQPYPKYAKAANKKHKRALEICVMDPHLGMQSYKGESDHGWSLDECEQMCLWSVNNLVDLAKAYGPFDEIVLPFGNDYMHHDNLLHTTTKGTPQPEGLSFFTVYERGIDLAFKIVDRLREIAPVKVLQIPGNHDHVSSFTLGHVLKARYHHDKAVTVDASASPYKFYHFGTNLIGFDHGHHVKPIRLASLMAHECRDIWASTTYREWHLGDQHRKGSSNPVVMEEQGVSVEYMRALTPPNSWHRLKGFNWQQRGSTAFVWDYHTGPLARIYANLDSYTGKPTGSK